MIEGDCLKVTTSAHTDLWQRTYYHFRNDNAPVFQMETERLLITEMTMDMAMDVHKNSLDEDTKRFVPEMVACTI